jgi:hypothetical protein
MKVTEKEIEVMAEKEYREYPSEPQGHANFNRDINCHRKRKAFVKGFKQAQSMNEWVSVEQIINYIENDAEIAIPIEDLMGENGIGLTKKQYGLVLLKHLVIELRNRFVKPSPPQT